MQPARNISRCLLKHARCPPIPAVGSSRLSSALGVTRTGTSVGPNCMANRTPRIDSQAGLATDERLITHVLGGFDYQLQPIWSRWARNAKRPAGFGALESHSHPRSLGIGSMRSGMGNVCHQSSSIVRRPVLRNVWPIGAGCWIEATAHMEFTIRTVTHPRLTTKVEIPIPRIAVRPSTFAALERLGLLRSFRGTTMSPPFGRL